MIIKINNLKAYNSIKIGNTERTFFSNHDTKILFDNEMGLIQLELRGAIAYTSMANVAWFSADVPLIKEKTNEQDVPKAKKNIKGATKKTNSKS